MDNVSSRVKLMGNLQAAVAEAVSGTMEERGRGFASDREAWAELKECIERTKQMHTDIEKVHKEMWSAVKDRNEDAFAALSQEFERSSRIKSGGKVVGYSDTVVYVRLHENGCYVPCDEAEAGGFCIKTAIDRKDEETGETTTYLEDFVYAFADGGLLGIEPVGSVENVSGTLMLAENDKVLDILLGGAAE